MNETETDFTEAKKKSFRKGLGIGILSTLIFLIILAMLLPGMITSNAASNAGSAISSLRTIAYVQQSVLEKEKKHCLSLAELFQAKLIDENLSKGEKSGYKFQILQSEKNCEVIAQPISSSTGKRTFYISEKDNWQFRFSKDENKVANADSPFLSY